MKKNRNNYLYLLYQLKIKSLHKIEKELEKNLGKDLYKFLGKHNQCLSKAELAMMISQSVPYPKKKRMELLLLFHYLQPKNHKFSPLASSETHRTTQKHVSHSDIKTMCNQG